MLPQVRKDDLVVQELPYETLVYDLKRHRAYCLNRTAALVWRRCDGRATVADISRHLQTELNVPVDEAVVWLALNRLDGAHLLQKQMELPAGGSGYSRREILQRLVVIGGLAVALPAVQSIVAPMAASAVTCSNSCTGKPNCTPCSNPGSRTCDKVCKNGSCVNKTGSGCP